ncbi:MAG: class I SAM-dependent methyltransferase [Deltaproteobacteria bacterium]|nr:class I SAM-dependent methyltransferase [Deltaproteobacteria bacterium]
MGESRIRAHNNIIEILKNWGVTGKILDAPAGTGEISKKLQDAGFEVYAADIAPEFFKLQGVKCEEVDLNHDLPYKDEFFDHILCSNGIEHLEDQYNFIRECYRVLKPKGKLLITTPNILNLKARVSNLFLGFPSFHDRPQNEVDDYAGGGHINMASYFDLRINLHRNGFKIILVTTHMHSSSAIVISFLFPFIYALTYRSFRRERNREQRVRNKEMLRHVLSRDLLFGKKLFVLAEKDHHFLKK